jgi:hypothetical protein
MIGSARVCICRMLLVVHFPRHCSRFGSLIHLFKPNPNAISPSALPVPQYRPADQIQVPPE